MKPLRKNRICKTLSAISAVVMILIISLVNTVYADSVFQTLQQYAGDTAAQQKAATAVSPFMGVIFFVIFIVCAVIIAVTILFILIKAWHVARGKDSIDKAWIGKISFVLIVCALFGSASGLKILDVFNSTGVNTAANIIQQAGEASTPLPLAAPTATPKK